jgi:hypothetical protein
MTDPTVTEALARTSMRRAVSIMAPASLFVGLPGAWSIVTTRGAAAPIVIVALACVAIVIAGAAIAAARNERQVERLDVAVLALAVIVQVAQFAVTWTGRRYWTDEARLNHDALRTLMSGHDPYPVSYPGVAAHGTGTPLLGGGSITHYSYPPFSLELGRALGSISDRLATPAVVGEIALLATVVATFLVLPRAWRSVAVTLTLGLDILPPLAHGGYAILLVLALMCGVLYRWTETGSEGRLGRLGLFRAICLGAAAASQQFAWFVALFVVLGILLVRRGELGTRKAALVVGRYVLVALTTFSMLRSS